MAYGYIGSMQTMPGHRDDVVGILLSGVDSLREGGCDLYIVSVSDADDATQSREYHHASLQLPETKAAMS